MHRARQPIDREQIGKELIRYWTRQSIDPIERAELTRGWTRQSSVREKIRTELTRGWARPPSGRRRKWKPRPRRGVRALLLLLRSPRGRALEALVPCRQRR